MEPGRVCVEFVQEEDHNLVTHKSVQIHRLEEQQHEGILCGNDYCSIQNGEVCISGSYCGCKPGEGRSAATGK